MMSFRRKMVWVIALGVLCTSSKIRADEWSPFVDSGHFVGDHFKIGVELELAGRLTSRLDRELRQTIEIIQRHSGQIQVVSDELKSAVEKWLLHQKRLNEGAALGEAELKLTKQVLSELFLAARRLNEAIDRYERELPVIESLEVRVANPFSNLEEMRIQLNGNSQSRWWNLRKVSALDVVREKMQKEIPEVFRGEPLSSKRLVEFVHLVLADGAQHFENVAKVSFSFDEESKAEFSQLQERLNYLKEQYEKLGSQYFIQSHHNQMKLTLHLPAKGLCPAETR